MGNTLPAPLIIRNPSPKLLQIAGPELQIETMFNVRIITKQDLFKFWISLINDKVFYKSVIFLAVIIKLQSAENWRKNKPSFPH